MNRYRSLFAFAFAMLVLFSSSSFMVGIHFCGGDIQHVALFTKAESCEMEKKVPPCHRQESKPCCEDATVVHEAQDFKGSISITVAAAPVVGVVQPLVLVAEVIPSSISSINLYTGYDPPIRSTDITTDLQVFLI